MLYKCIPRQKDLINYLPQAIMFLGHVDLESLDNILLTLANFEDAFVNQ